MRVPYTSSTSQINKFLQNLNDYLDSGIYCDLTFIIAYEKFPCHRIILASASPYFQALLTHRFKENDLNSIELRDIEPQIFSLLLHYIYSGKIDIDNNNVHDILIASDMLQLDEVAQFCCHYLSISLNETNVIDIWKIADELGCSSLKENAEHYILTNFCNLIKFNIIKSIPHNLLIKIISNDDLIIDNEEQVLEAILIWYYHNHEQSFGQLFDSVRFEYISKEHQKKILHQIGFENPSIIHRIEQLITNRECRINNSPVRRGMRQTCYLFGGYGSNIDDDNSHLLTASYRCHFDINDSSPSSHSIEIEQIPGDEMRYPRMHHQIAALGSFIYTVGGEDGDNIFNSVEIFDSLSKVHNEKWRQGNSMITPRCNFGLVSLDSTTLYALGGHIGADITSSIEMFNSQTGQWIVLPYKLKSPCYGFACVQLNGLIICIGGSCIFNLPVKTTEIFNPRTGQSYLCTDMNEARTLCSACIDDEHEKIYVFGGADANGNGLRSVEAYNSSDCRWYKLPSMLFNRISPCVYRIGYYIFVFGGRTSLAHNSEILNTAEIYHIEKKTWIRTNDVPIHIYGAATVLR
ncbi:unnamed protein product [Rotaria magnacalcarata]|uniref:BTB domain-containing protein n=2 Tax=Rotaria magnacalcarata TaxID=392030 RepID=A0A815S9J8_9BILA|nr:unnamed protein product [Rotaria magnacalcarata]CAF2159390.1 unnamed protein product [Rotaria magnacalcarata]